MNQKVIERIKVLRTERKFTQAYMADELGITSGAYSNIERGATPVTLNRLSEIAKILKVEISEIIVDDKMKSNNISDPLKNYGFATKGDIEELMHIIKQLQNEVEKIKNGKVVVKKVLAKKKK